jgi:hypothetical protein
VRVGGRDRLGSDHATRCTPDVASEPPFEPQIEPVHVDPRDTGQGVMPDGTSRFSMGEAFVSHGMLNVFVQVLWNRAGQDHEDAPTRFVTLRGVTTGIGRFLYRKVSGRQRGGVRPRRDRAERDQGALVGADKIIGVDLNPARAMAASSA